MAQVEDFSCNRAAVLLGHPQAEVGPCHEMLPGVWRAVLKAPGIGPGDALVRTFAWHDGQAEAPGGPRHLATVLRRMDAHALERVEPFAAQVLLEATGGAPPGFAPHTVGGDVGGERAAIRTRPFGLTLVMANWREPAEPFMPIPGGPQTGPGPGPLGPPPGSGPVGGPPPGSGPVGGPPPGGGLMPPTTARATLALDASYRGQWTIEVRRMPGGPFETVKTIPVAP